MTGVEFVKRYAFEILRIDQTTMLLAVMALVNAQRGGRN